MIFKNSKKEKKINAMFLSANESDEAFMKEMYNYATAELSKTVHPFFRRVTNFFILEWIFAVQRNIAHDLVEYMSQYGFLKHIQTKPKKFLTRFYFDCLAMWIVDQVHHDKSVKFIQTNKTSCALPVLWQ